MKKNHIVLMTLAILLLPSCGAEQASITKTAHSLPQPPLSTPSDVRVSENPPEVLQQTSEATQELVITDLIPSEGLEFESNGDGTCSLVGIGVCQDTNLVIPITSPEGDVVTCIEQYAFMGLEDVACVTLLNYFYEVEDHAFQYGEMETVQIIGGTPVIGESVFSGCEDLTRIVIQNCTLQLEEYAFYGCGDTAEVTISDCTGRVGERAFQYSDLSSLTIERCDLTVKESAFSSNEALTAITFQDSVISTEEYAFYGVGDAAQMVSKDCTMTLAERAFQYASLAAVTITGGNVEMEESTFSSCEDLTTIFLDGATVSMGDYAFYGCKDLTSVSICDNANSDNTIQIGDRAFQYCEHLTTVMIGGGHIELGESVFSGCAEELVVTIGGADYSVSNY